MLDGFDLLGQLLVICMMAGCAKETGEPSPQNMIYYVNREGTGLYPVALTEDPEGGEDWVRRLLSDLETPSDKLEYTPPIGGTVSLNSFSLSDRQLVLDFSGTYRELDPVTEILDRAAIVRTLTQLPDVDGVSFTVDGEPLTDAQGTPVGVMNGEQFILNAGHEINAYEQTELTLYFANEDGDALREVKRTVVYSSNISLDRLVAEELVSGLKESEDAYPALNPSVKVISTTVTDGICYVNFDSAFLIQYYPVQPEIVIYSVVNSLVSLPNVNKVMISVNGDNNVVYLEKIPLNNPFERNLEIVK